MTRLLFVKLFRDLRTTWNRIALMIIAISISLIAFSTVLYAYAIVDSQISLGQDRVRRGSWAGSDERHPKPGRSEPGVIDATLRTVSTFQMQTKDGRLSAVPLQLFVASASDQMRVARFPVEQGSWPPPAGGVLIEREALSFLNLKVGDTVVITSLDGKPVSLRITGVVHDPSLAPAYEEQKGYGYISTATLPLLGKPPVLDELAITVADQPGGTVPSHNRDTIAHTALHLADRLKHMPGIGIEQIQVPQPYQHPHQGQMNALLMAFLVFGILSLLLSAILITTMFNGLLTRQIPQIGMLKAIGASLHPILLLYLIMILLVAVAATAIVFVPGIVLGRVWVGALLYGLLNMDATSLAVPWWTYAVVLATGVVLPLVMALFPLVRASRRTVREALDDRGVDQQGGHGKTP